MLQSMSSRSNRYPGQRPLRIALRTIHLACVAMVIGAVGFGQNPEAWVVMLVLSGIGIIADDLYKYGEDYFRFAQFWALIVKIGLVVLGSIFPEMMWLMLMGALVVGSVISHSPGAIRHFSLWGPKGPCASRVGKASCRK